MYRMINQTSKNLFLPTQLGLVRILEAGLHLNIKYQDQDVLDPSLTPVSLHNFSMVFLIATSHQVTKLDNAEL